MKWDRSGEKGKVYRRYFPDSSYHRIVTKKAKLFGRLMYCVLKAGGHPAWFRYDILRDVPFEQLLDSLIPNYLEFKIDLGEKIPHEYVNPFNITIGEIKQSISARKNEAYNLRTHGLISQETYLEILEKTDEYYEPIMTSLEKAVSTMYTKKDK